MDDKKILWNETHERLQALMQKEVGAMREVLANMHQEELSILLKDSQTLNQVMQERSNLVGQLSALRNERLTLTKQLEELVSDIPKGKEIPLEILLPPNDENTCEILSLRDQIMALVDRMNLQNTRNTLLFNQGGYRFELSTQPLPQTDSQRPKRKPITLAVYPEKE